MYQGNCRFGAGVTRRKLLIIHTKSGIGDSNSAKISRFTGQPVFNQKVTS